MPVKGKGWTCSEAEGMEAVETLGEVDVLGIVEGHGDGLQQVELCGFQTISFRLH